MSFYLLLHIVFSIVLCYFWILIFKKYIRTSWIYFLIYSISASLWFILYVSIFSSSNDISLILNVNRFMHALSLLGMYSMLLFVVNIDNQNHKKSKQFKLNLIVFTIFSIIWSLTPFIIENMNFIDEKWHYLENYGSLYWIFALLYILFIPFFWIISYYKIKSLTIINKLRLKYICVWFFLFILVSIIVLVLLPLFWIIILEKYQVLFLVPFIISLQYSLKSYYSINIKTNIIRILTYVLSIIASLIVILTLKILFDYFWGHFWSFWGITSKLSTLDIVLWIITFSWFNKIFSYYIYQNWNKNTFSKNIWEMKRKFIHSTDLYFLNKLIKFEFENKLNIKYANVQLFENDWNNYEIYNYFNNRKSNKIFINDIVFIEENKYKFNKKLIQDNNSHNFYLALPIYIKEKLIWIFYIGDKPLKENYYSDEIDTLKELRDFLEWHLKYIKIYKTINDLSINLDKKVDEKTIKYNNLLNKQKEFISILSHEIKWPIASCIFQVDCLIDDVNEWEFTEKYLKNELDLLNTQLLKSWELINKLFAVQKVDTEKLILFKEKINLNNLIQKEVELYKKNNPNIKFNTEFDNNVGFIDIDKVHFMQVINNLINNSIKFSKKSNPIINIAVIQIESKIVIKIEDNWSWIENIDIISIFDKYKTWSSSSIWIWMWLFLCKSIVELHEWTINAKKSTKYWWACFIISLPKN